MLFTNLTYYRISVVGQFEKSSKDCHSEARLSREESAGLLLAASSFLADKAGFGMTRRAFLRNLTHYRISVLQASCLLHGLQLVRILRIRRRDYETHPRKAAWP